MDGINWSITEGRQPVGSDLAVLQARRRTLSAPPAALNAIGAAVARLFLRFPSMAKTSAEQVAAYAQDLAHFPAWAIAKGMSDIVGGLALKQTEFPPTSLDVQKAVRKVMEPVWAEQAHIDAVLSAKPISGAPTPFDAEARKAITAAARAMMRHNAPKDIRQPLDRSQLGGSFGAAVYVPSSPDASLPKLSD